MKIQILNIKQAYDLYVLIQPVFPENETNIFRFIKLLIHNIQEKDPNITYEILKLILGEDDSTINEINEADAVGYMVSGFEENSILDLMGFFKAIIHD